MAPATRTPLARPLPPLRTPREAAGASQSRGTSASPGLSENKLPAQHSHAAGRSGAWPSYAFPLPAGNSLPLKNPFTTEIQTLFADLHPERSWERNRRFLKNLYDNSCQRHLSAHKIEGCNYLLYAQSHWYMLKQHQKAETHFALRQRFWTI